MPGRRIFIEGLAVTGDTARVSLRAAHDLDLKVRVFGGRTGKTLKMGANAIVHSGEAKTYNLTLDGPKPSFTFSWTDSLGFSGAVSLKSGQLPYPLPRYDGELCDLEVVSLEWTPGSVSGRHRLGVHHGDPAGGGPAGLRRPLQPVGARAAGRERHQHRRNGERRRRCAPHQRGIRSRRPDPTSGCPSPTRRRSTTWRSRRS